MTSGRLLLGGLVFLAVAAPAMIGAVHPRTQVLLSAAVLLLTAIYVFERGDRGLRLVPFSAAAGLGIIFSALQLVPLPSSLIHRLSPHAFDMRTDSVAAFPAWMPITLDVSATSLEVIKGFACLGLLMSAVGVARSSRRGQALLWTLALLGGGLAIVTFLQRALGAQAILGIYRPRSLPGAGFFGTFVNGNHAASVFALSALIAAGLALQNRAARHFALVWSAGLSVAALLFTGSRMGAVALGAGAAFMIAVLLQRRVGWSRALIATALLLGIASAGSLVVAETLHSRLSLVQVHGIWNYQKVRGWRDGLAMAADYPWTGVGRGAFEAPLGAYRTNDEGVRLVYPENLAVQIVSEWGFLAAAVIVVLVGSVMVRMARPTLQLEPAALGAAAGVIAVLVHDLADFGLEMPSVAFPTLVALGVVVARVEDRRRLAPRTLRTRWPITACALAGWTVALFGAAWASTRTLTADCDRLDEGLRNRIPMLREALAQAIARHPADDHLELLATEEAFLRKDPRAIHHLNRALRLHPANPQAHHLAAIFLAQAGHLSQAALEYRLAAEHGQAVPIAEIERVTGAYVIDAVPQRIADLLAVARFLVSRGRPDEADLACRRAVEISTDVESAMLERLQVAAISANKSIIVEAARSLLATNPSARSYAAAAKVLQAAGEPARSDQAVLRGLDAHPDAAGLVLLGSRLRLERGDLNGARLFLQRATRADVSLTERQEAEELLAAVEEKAGDLSAALRARARARMIARKIKDSVGP